MRTLCLVLGLCGLLRAEAVRIELPMSPEQWVAHLLSAGEAKTELDCRLLAFWPPACTEGASAPAVRDVTLRRVQLDSDDELEAVVVATAANGSATLGLVFDRQGQWQAVGVFECRRRCDTEEFLHVRKLTVDSPPVVLVFTDLGGSDGTIMTTRAHALVNGRLVPAGEFRNMSRFELPGVTREESTRVYVSRDETRLVLETEERVQGSGPKRSCRVQRWDEKAHAFADSDGERSRYCNAGGQAKPGMSGRSGLVVYP